MGFDTISSGGQEVPVDSASLGTGAATFYFNEGGNSLNFLTFSLHGIKTRCMKLNLTRHHLVSCLLLVISLSGYVHRAKKSSDWTAKNGLSGKVLMSVFNSIMSDRPSCDSQSKAIMSLSNCGASHEVRFGSF